MRIQYLTTSCACVCDALKNSKILCYNREHVFFANYRPLRLDFIFITYKIFLIESKYLTELN